MVTKFVINASGAIWWQNLQPIQVVAQQTQAIESKSLKLSYLKLIQIRFGQKDNTLGSGPGASGNVLV